MKILSIETSCDETAAALIEFKSGGFKILSNIVSSSVELQAKYGGIVPEIAARKQMEMIIPAIQKAVGPPSLKLRHGKCKNIPDYIAVTNGPGLITSLRVGVEAAKTLSYAWDRPLIAVNHMEGHIYASAISNFQFPISKQFPSLNFELPKWKFPVLALLVSGGHTQLVLMKNHLKYNIIGETLDDAVGEAFDKVAKILDLGYPGGPIISKLAAQGDTQKFDLPRPMINSGDYNFSFSGLKTAVLYLVKKLKVENKKSKVNDICASFETACVDVLAKKTIKAAVDHGVKTIAIGGGVSANQKLKKQLGEIVASKLPEVKYMVPDIKYTGDNAVMIALAAYYRVKNKKISDWRKIKTDPNLRLG